MPGDRYLTTTFSTAFSLSQTPTPPPRVRLPTAVRERSPRSLFPGTHVITTRPGSSERPKSSMLSLSLFASLIHIFISRVPLNDRLTDWPKQITYDYWNLKFLCLCNKLFFIEECFLDHLNQSISCWINKFFLDFFWVVFFICLIA